MDKHSIDAQTFGSKDNKKNANEENSSLTRQLNRTSQLLRLQGEINDTIQSHGQLLFATLSKCSELKQELVSQKQINASLTFEIQNARVKSRSVESLVEKLAKVEQENAQLKTANKQLVGETKRLKKAVDRLYAELTPDSPCRTQWHFCFFSFYTL